MLLIWLAIGMYEIVSFILGALALLALGIVVLTNNETTLKYLIVQERGNRLAEKVKTKWYNEGEKSSKYFLGLLKRKIPDDFKSLTDGS